MAIFKRQENNSSAPEAKVFTPDDLGAMPPGNKLNALSETPAPETPTAPDSEPAHEFNPPAMVDGVSGNTTTPDAPAPEAGTDMPVSPMDQLAPATEAAVEPETDPIPITVGTTALDNTASEPTETPEPEIAEVKVEPDFSEPEAAEVSAEPNPAPEPEVVVAPPTPEPPATFEATPPSVDTPEALEPDIDTPAHSSKADPAMQDLAHRVSQALVDLEELRGQKEDMELQLKELQNRHGELDRRIEQQRKITTDLLDQVHKAIVGTDMPEESKDSTPGFAPPPPEAPKAQPKKK